MSLSILNNVAALYAQNNLSSSSASLQNTLQQLSSGSRINSGADDPSGLAVSDGLTANQSALTQSSRNATNGIGMLQTADGSLSQVTGLLNQAVTLATQASNGTLTGAQVSSANQEYQNIMTQINNIGATTNFNSIKIFDTSSKTMVVSDGTTAGTTSYAENIGALTSLSVGTGVAFASTAVTTSNATDTATITSAVASNVLNGTVAITGGSGGPFTATFDGKTTAATLAEYQSGGANYAATTAAGLTATGSATTIVFTSTTVGDTLGATNNATQSTLAQVAAGGVVGTGVDLSGALTSANAATKLNTITTAIADVAYQRGTLGGEINQLSSAASVASAEQVNLASAQNSVTATDYGQAASNLSKYQILSQTGISALAQANSVQQEVLKLLQ